MKLLKKYIAIVTVIAIMLCATVSTNAHGVDTAEVSQGNMAQALESNAALMTAEEMAYFTTQAASIDLYNEILDSFTATSTRSSGSTERTYPDYYGGAYIDEDTGELVMLVTQLQTARTAMQNTLARSSDTVRYALCDVSYNEMVGAIDAITQYCDTFEDQGICIDMISDDIMAGEVVVGVRDYDLSKDAAIRDVFDYPFLRIENSEGIAAEAFGGGYRASMFGGYSTVCFAAKQNGVNGLVVSGHAAPQTGIQCFINGSYVGTVTETAWYNNSTADAAFVTVFDWVDITNIMSNGSCIYTASSGILPVNTVVYKFGQKTGLTSGNITATNVSVNYSGATIQGCCRTTYVSDEGDSGAPVLVYRGSYGSSGNSYTLYGIHSGGFTGAKLFSPYANIVNELGVTCIGGY